MTSCKIYLPDLLFDFIWQKWITYPFLAIVESHSSSENNYNFVSKENRRNGYWIWIVVNDVLRFCFFSKQEQYMPCATQICKYESSLCPWISEICFMIFKDYNGKIFCSCCYEFSRAAIIRCQSLSGLNNKYLFSHNCGS